MPLVKFRSAVIEHAGKWFFTSGYGEPDILEVASEKFSLNLREEIGLLLFINNELLRWRNEQLLWGQEQSVQLH